LEQVIPLINEFDNEVKSKGLELIDKAEVKILENKYEVKYNVKKIYIESLRPILFKAANVMNCLESFAIFFTTGLASEEVAFNSVGGTYCDAVKRFLPIINIGAHTEKYYQNIIKLYFLWNNRYEAEKHFLDKDRIEKQIQKIGGKAITPIGLK
jgi:hypothetical protein